MIVDRMLCKALRNCDRYVLEVIEESSIPILGISNHSERNATNQACGSLKNNGILDIANQILQNDAKEAISPAGLPMVQLQWGQQLGVWRCFVTFLKISLAAATHAAWETRKVQFRIKMCRRTASVTVASSHQPSNYATPSPTLHPLHEADPL